jgi:hypothetical protein
MWERHTAAHPTSRTMCTAVRTQIENVREAIPPLRLQRIRTHGGSAAFATT